MTITVLVTDADLTVIGDPLRWTSLDVTLRFNQVATGTVTCPAHPETMNLLDGGNRLLVIRDGAVFVAGPYEGDDYDWEVGEDPGQVVVNFADDLALIAGRITYPDPTLAATSTSQPAYWTASATAAGTVMRNLANVNAGPGALAARQVTALTMGAGTGIGDTVSFSTRFQPLLDELRTLAVVGGGLGFGTTQDGTDIVFDVYEPVDRSTGVGAVRYSRSLGNLRKVSRKRRRPSVTAAIIGGQGEGDARTIRERTNTTGITDWWRVETFVDQRQTNDTTELDQAGDEALSDGAETVALAVVTVDTDTQRYGEHYNLGDKVAVEPVPGFQLADLVRAVRLVADENGEQITSTVGTDEAVAEPKWIRQMRALDRRLGRLEAR